MVSQCACVDSERRWTRAVEARTAGRRVAEQHRTRCPAFEARAGMLRCAEEVLRRIELDTTFWRSIDEFDGSSIECDG